MKEGERERDKERERKRKNERDREVVKKGVGNSRLITYNNNSIKWKLSHNSSRKHLPKA